jgi:putative flippase GtrA
VDVSQVLSYAAGMLNSYIINRSWTFRSEGAFFGPQMRRFIAVNLSLLILSLVVLHVGMDVFGLKKLPAKLCATALTVVLGFALNRLWVFRT